MSRLCIDAFVFCLPLVIDRLGRSGRRYCQVLTLTYTDTTANFATANKFSVPPVYDLYSALAHGDLNGMLVHINKAVIGIYLVDANSDKAICFQTGIAIVCFPSYYKLAAGSDHRLYRQIHPKRYFLLTTWYCTGNLTPEALMCDHTACRPFVVSFTNAEFLKMTSTSAIQFILNRTTVASSRSPRSHPTHSNACEARTRTAIPDSLLSLKV